jgi:hypothetical protein
MYSIHEQDKVMYFKPLPIILCVYCKKEGRTRRSAFFVRLRFVEEIASKLFKRAEVAREIPKGIGQVGKRKRDQN